MMIVIDDGHETNHGLDLDNLIFRLGEDRRLILGIDGLSRSGKTSFSHTLVDKLRESGHQVAILHLDDFIVTRAARYDTGYEPWYEFYNLQWDVSYLLVNLFARLHAASKLELPFYDSGLDTLEAREVHLPVGGIVIVEGVFLQRPEWRPLLDYVIYLDCDRETRFAREQAESQADLEKFRHRYWPAEDYYLQTVEPTIHADMVIRSTDVK